MKSKNMFKRIALGTFLSVLLLFGIVVYHIATMPPIDNATVQISRIDFDQKLDSIKSIEIKNSIRSINGVKNDVIIKENVLVYFHDNRIADSKQVYEALMTKVDMKAKRFEVPADLVNKSTCPVTGTNGIINKFTSTVQHIFN
ncbi:MAG: hypothetical protein WAT92_23990 [Saprospiraceae bacterium]